MIRFLLLCLSLFLTTLAAIAQTGYVQPGSSSDTGFVKGDTIRARTARHHTEDTATQLRVQLGYIDADSATVQQIMDNMAVGIRVVRFGNYKVVRFAVSIMSPGRDFVSGKFINGSRPRYSDFDGWYKLSFIRPGDKLIIDASVQRDGADYKLGIRGPSIRVVR